MEMLDDTCKMSYTQKVSNGWRKAVSSDFLQKIARTATENVRSPVQGGKRRTWGLIVSIYSNIFVDV